MKFTEYGYGDPQTWGPIHGQSDPRSLPEREIEFEEHECDCGEICIFVGETDNSYEGYTCPNCKNEYEEEDFKRVYERKIKKIEEKIESDRVEQLLERRE